MNQTNPYLLPLLANGLSCVIGLAMAGLAISRTRRLLLLPVSVATLLITNGVFIAVPLIMTVDVPFPTAPLLYARAATVHCIFVAVVAFPLLLLAIKRRSPAHHTQTPKLPAFVPLVITGLGLAGVFYFLIRNSEIISLSIAIYRTDSYESYISARNTVGQVFMEKSASGNGLMSLAFSFFCPAALALLPLATSISIGPRRLLQAIAWLCMAVSALLVGSRFMLTFTLIYPLILWRFSHLSRLSLLARLRNSWKTVLLWTGCGALAISIFQSIMQTTMLEAAFLLFARIFVAPGAVSGGYYWLFPDIFAFRGASGIFMMPISSDLVDFSMISLAATGFDSHANGSFLATAYSAAGYWGVLIVSVVFVFGALLADLMLLRVHHRLASLIVFANLFGILTISSVAFRVSVVTQGFLLGPIFVLLLITLARNILSSKKILSPPSPIEVQTSHG